MSSAKWQPFCLDLNMLTHFTLRDVNGISNRSWRLIWWVISWVFKSTLPWNECQTTSLPWSQHSDILSIQINITMEWMSNDLVTMKSTFWYLEYSNQHYHGMNVKRPRYHEVNILISWVFKSTLPWNECQTTSLPWSQHSDILSIQINITMEWMSNDLVTMKCALAISHNRANWNLIWRNKIHSV